MNITHVRTAKEKVFEALIAAFTFVAALSWRETFIKIVEHYTPNATNQLIAELIISSLVTVLVIVFIITAVTAEKAVDTTFDLEKESKDN